MSEHIHFPVKSSGAKFKFRLLMSAALAVLILFSGLLNASGSRAPNPIKFNRMFETGGYNFDITQDREGFIWVGTINGVRVFDGYEVKSYTASEETFPTNNIRTVFVDAEGLIWFATFGGLAVYDKNSATFTTYLHDPDNPESISSSVFNGSPNLIAETGDGLLWFGTSNGLNRYDKKTGMFTRYMNDPENKNSLSDNNILSVYCDKEGLIWIGTKNGGLNRLDPKTKKFTHYTHNPTVFDKSQDIGAGEVNTVVEDAHGDLWIGMSKSGLKKFHRKTGTFTHYRHDPKDPESLASDDIRAIVSSKNGNLWICHPYWVAVGIERFDGKTGTFTQYKRDPANPHVSLSDRVQIAFEDQSGILWIGENLSTIRTYDKHFHKFHLYRPDPADKNSVVSNVIAIVEDRDNQVWVGSGTEGLVRYNREQDNFIRYLFDLDHPSDKNLTAMYVDGTGNFWIVTNDGVLSLFDAGTGRFLKHYHYPGLVEAWGILEDPKDPETLWFATENNGILRFNKKAEQFTAYEPDGANAILVHALGVHADGEGELWFTNESSGLIRYDRKRDRFTPFAHSDHPQSINSNHINYFYESSRGTIWVSSQEGLNQFEKNKGTFTRFEEKAGVHLPLRGILEDNHGFLWISSDAGLLKFDTGTGRAVKFYQEGGLKFNFSPLSVLKTRDGEMWFSSDVGVIRFNPDQVKENHFVPPVYLTAITQGGENMKTGMAPEKVRNINLNWRQNFFEFKYTALNYTRAGQNQYAYMLEGFDKEWYQAGARRYGRYSGLPGGRYTLRVKGSNNDGVWNREGVSLEVQVARPWWRTRLFLWSIFGLLILLPFCIYLMRVRSINKRSLELERRVEEKTRALQEALDNVKTLTGLIPICANCKKIRDDTGYWGQVEEYIRKHSEAEFSHSICPDCVKVLYPDFADDLNKTSQGKSDS